MYIAAKMTLEGIKPYTLCRWTVFNMFTVIITMHARVSVHDAIVFLFYFSRKFKPLIEWSKSAVYSCRSHAISMSSEEDKELLEKMMNSDIEYDMEPEPNESTGVCMIFDICTFKADCIPTRKGSEKDVASIQNVFGNLFGFEVRVLKDQTGDQMQEQLINIGKNFKPAWRCFVCFFLSHGTKEDTLVDVKGESVDVDMLVHLLDGKNCTKMNGKPKLFFAQMCRGFDKDEYERSRGYDNASSGLPPVKPANISPDRDRLICHATSKGRMAPMDPEKGSLFIQTLTKVLELSNGKKSIQDVLQVVVKYVDDQSKKTYKVCPAFESTLVGKLVFKVRPKSSVPRVPQVPRMFNRSVLSVIGFQFANMASFFDGLNLNDE